MKRKDCSRESVETIARPGRVVKSNGGQAQFLEFLDILTYIHINILIPNEYFLKRHCCNYCFCHFHKSKLYLWCPAEREWAGARVGQRRYSIERGSWGGRAGFAVSNTPALTESTSSSPSSQPPAAPAPRNLMPPSSFYGHGTHTHMPTHTYIKLKVNKSLKERHVCLLHVQKKQWRTWGLCPHPTTQAKGLLNCLTAKSVHLPTFASWFSRKFKIAIGMVDRKITFFLSHVGQTISQFIFCY